MESRSACLLALSGALVASLLVAAAGILFWSGARMDGGAAAAPEDTGTERAAEPEVLAPGAPREGAIELASARQRDFVVEIPERAVALHLELISSETELLLQASPERPNGDESFEFARATESGFTSLTIGRFSSPAIAPGRLRVRVA
jgi:hypothetical protein